MKDEMYFRVERNGKWQNVCFCDLTLDEIDKVTANRSAEWWKRVALYLRDVMNGEYDYEA